jgi:hypothetical protein
MASKMGAVDCDLQYSRRAAAFTVVAALATAALAAMLPVPVAVRASIAALVALAAVRAWRALGAVRRLHLAPDGAVGVVRADGSRVSGRLRPGSFAAPWLVALRWRPEGARFDRALLLVPGMAPEAALRDIRVILRWA